jgi:hypothetical protein
MMMFMQELWQGLIRSGPAFRQRDASYRHPLLRALYRGTPIFIGALPSQNRPPGSARAHGRYEGSSSLTEAADNDSDVFDRKPIAGADEHEQEDDFAVAFRDGTAHLRDRNYSAAAVKLQIATGSEDLVVRSTALNNLGVALWRLDLQDQADYALHEAIRLGDNTVQRAAETNLSIIARKNSELDLPTGIDNYWRR